ncbi:MAG TPA: GTPase, partial [Streptomyces sp.]|nr:GTPase [Streptomyces sp.]
MSTTDVRADGSSDEKQATSGDTEGGDGSLGETGEAREASASGGGLSRETGETGETVDGADADEEAGAWDDGLIARRARGASVPGERQAGSRAAALWGVEPGPASSDAGTADESGWEFAGGAGRSEPQRASDSHGTSQGALGRAKPGGQPLTDWPSSDASPAQAYENEAQGEAGSLGRRVVALHRLLDLSRSRIPGSVLAEGQRVLDSAGARKQLPRAYTTVAIAGATGSGKSSLFNALAGTRLSQAGMRRPTTATPVACSWEVPGAGPADGLLDRLAIPTSTRRLMRPESDWRGRIDDAARHELEGLVLIDLPDHDSAAEGHREQVDRLLRLVDAVVWVVDPEKYADAVLHERYLRPLAGYAEVTFIVLNQTDRLPGEAKDAVLNDLRRLLDEDGMALGD